MKHNGAESNIPGSMDSRLFQEQHKLQVMLQSMIEGMPDAILALDRNGRITYANNEAIRIFPTLKRKRPPEEPFWQTLPSLNPYRKAFHTVIEDGRPIEFNKETWSRQVFRLALSPLVIEERIGVVLRISDMTEQEKIQAHLIQSQKMEAVETLVGGITHDFNNILSGMMMTIDYLQQYVLSSEEAVTRDDISEEIEILGTSVRRASNLVQQLLLLSTRKDTNVVPVDLRAAVDSVIKICRQSFDKGIEFNIQLPGVPAQILADEAQLEQVILNMCINASHAMTIMRSEDEKWGGTLSVGLTHVTIDNSAEHSILNPPAGDFWCLSVEDTGVGIDETIQKKIFEPFFTTKEKGKGSGLGLAMVYSILKRYNGHINVYSERGRGTVFQAYFPLDKQGSLVSRKGKPETVRHQGTGTALVIDDEDFIRRSLERLLQKTGFTVHSASHGERGLELFRRHYKDISFVLLDMIMPGESGKAVFLEMRELQPSVKVILMSGFQKDHRIEEVLEYGNCVFLKKPFNQDELFAKLEAMIGPLR